MNMNILQRILSLFQIKPGPKFIASQLRKPTGFFADQIAENMNGFNEPLFDLTFDTMAPAEKEHLLEIGFGSGLFFKKIFNKVNDVQISGLDFSPEMVKKAEKINPDYIKSGKLVLQVGASDNIPFNDNSFDKVYCNNVVYFWENPQLHLEEIRRVLKPGGKFYAGIRTKTSMIKFPPTQFGFTLYEPEDWENVLKENGFVDTSISLRTDPPIEIDGKTQVFESACICGVLK